MVLNGADKDDDYFVFKPSFKANQHFDFREKIKNWLLLLKLCQKLKKRKQNISVFHL
jgi:hypothetical protein